MLRMREGCQQAADLGGGHGGEVAYVVHHLTAITLILPLIVVTLGYITACRTSCRWPTSSFSLRSATRTSCESS
jgi:uncharacterized membrane protein